ncbi:MAG: GGDEF domain-containing phosphodiesterase, partial [Oscillospiraceae bacterium]
YINDLFGLEEGDKILRYIADILKSITAENGVCGRVGGDIFCICMAYEHAAELKKVTTAITQKISEYNLGYRITPYFGICRVEDRNIPVSILCDWAHLALKTIKGNMLTNAAYYDDELRARQLQERKIEEEMERALEEKQFEIYFQPKYQIETGKIIGTEALVRWNHPQDGIVLPNSFIPLFESNGFIIRLDEYVWDETFRMLREWIDKGHKPVPISVNVSRIHIYNSEFLNKLIELTKKYRLPQNLVELELTESTFVDNQDELYSTLEGLQKKGLNFSIDDFGSGYSSLNMLRNSTAEILKLDREFLSATADDEKAQAVVRHTISMANELNMQVVAEGVETKGQADFLKSAGCLAAQGYFYSKPMPISEFEELMIY